MMYKPGQEENGDADEEASFIAVTQKEHEALDISNDIDNDDNVEDMPATTRSRWHPLKHRDGRKQGEFVNVANM